LSLFLKLYAKHVRMLTHITSWLYSYVTSL